jgi:beta-lactamase class A
MLAILSSPELDDKFVKVLEPEVPLRCLHRKSGEWRSWHSDSVLVWGEQHWRRYILVGLVDNRRGEQVLKGLVPMAEHLLETRETPSAVYPARGFLK